MALPEHGRIDCTKCFNTSAIEFDTTKRTEGSWRITSNPLAWGNPAAEIVVLGFSKGPTQAGALATSPHDAIAYKGSRSNVGKILGRIGILSLADESNSASVVDKAIADRTGKFHFGSLVRCTVERFDQKAGLWKGSGGGMLDRFVQSDLGQEVTYNCTSQFLSHLPDQTKLVVMFGLGTQLGYVKEAFKLFQKARGGNWQWVNDVTYTDGYITVVHVEHFASQGALIPNWLGQNDHPRGNLSKMAKDGVFFAGIKIHKPSD